VHQQLMPQFPSKEELEEKGVELSGRRGNILKERYLSQVKAFADVRPLFERIRADGTRIVLATLAKVDKLETYKRSRISKALTMPRPRPTCGGIEAEPDIFEAALSKLGEPTPDEVVVVGYTSYDAEAAAKARLRTTDLCGGLTEDSLREAGCIAIYQVQPNCWRITSSRRSPPRRPRANPAMKEAK
jgi:phosphoglycolate phosphatase-like HAD superfamily hydrolase